MVNISVLTITKRDQYFTVVGITVDFECFHCGLHCNGVTVDCECFHYRLHCLVGHGKAAGTWHLGCQAWALGRPRALGRAPGWRHLALRLVEALACRHLARGLPSLGRYGQIHALGCNPRANGSAEPLSWGLQPRAFGLQTRALGADPHAGCKPGHRGLFWPVLGFVDCPWVLGLDR